MTPDEQAQRIAEAMQAEAQARTSKEIGDAALRAIEAETRLTFAEGERDSLRQITSAMQGYCSAIVAALAWRVLAGDPSVRS